MIINFEIIGYVLTFLGTLLATILGSGYIFFRNFRNDIRSDMHKFEERWQSMDEKYEKHRESMDKKWYDLLREIHKLDKKIIQK